MAEIVRSVTAVAYAPPRTAPPPPPPPQLLAPAPPPYLPPPYVPLPDGKKPPGEIRWRWTHLWLFGAVVFGLPGGLTAALSPSDRLSEFLDGALYFQIVGYLLGVLLITHMVRKLQGGDWSTLGISWNGEGRRDLLAGAGFGLLLIGCFLPISFLLGGGKLEVDGLVRIVVGSTSGLGLALAAIVVVIGAPVIEEIYFRGILFEKLARRNVAVAIIVTTVLFTMAHGALLIPVILIFGLALAWQRRTKSLWYTMGAHAAWNLAVTVMAAFLLLGGWSFSPADGAYTIRLPRSWERVDSPPFPVPGATLDLAVTTNNGSGLVIMRVPTSQKSAVALLEELVAEADRQGMKGVARTEIQGHDHLFDEGADSAHMVYGLTQGGVEVGSHLFVLRLPGSPTALVFNLVCQRLVCTDDAGHLDKAMHDLDFAPAVSPN